MKIAILITAYKNEVQLNNLVEHLAEDFDIYIHLDKRSTVYVKKMENVFIYQKYKSYWGSINTVLAVILLLSEASKKSYDRYIQITGQDLPIKTNKQINDFFELHRNTNFIEYFKLPDERWANGGYDRLTKYWGKEPSKLVGFEKFQAKLVYFGLNLIYKSPIAFIFFRDIKYQFFGGSNYMDLTDNCVKYILEYLEKKPKYLKRFKNTLIPEEIFFQTIVLNNQSETVIANKVLRYIDWQTGPDYPRTFTNDDYERIMNSENLFARKFDEKLDNIIIKRILENVS